MNVYFLLAGVIGFLGGIAHTFLGHKWTVKALDPEKLQSTQNTGEQDARYLTWFWHIGSLLLLSSSAILILHGLMIKTFSIDLIEYVCILWLGTTLLFFVLGSRKPSQLLGMIPGWVGVPVNILILLGLLL